MMDASNRDAKDLLPRGGRFVFNPGVPLPAHVPKAPGLYAIFDRDDGPLMYVGIAKTNLRNRLKQHNQGGRMGSNFVLMLSDMLIFPKLTAEELADIAAGKINAGWYTIDRIREMAVHYEVMDPAEARSREAVR